MTSSSIAITTTETGASVPAMISEAAAPSSLYTKPDDVVPNISSQSSTVNGGSSDSTADKEGNGGTQFTHNDPDRGLFNMIMTNIQNSDTETSHKSIDSGSGPRNNHVLEAKAQSSAVTAATSTLPLSSPSSLLKREADGARSDSRASKNHTNASTVSIGVGETNRPKNDHHPPSSLTPAITAATTLARNQDRSSQSSDHREDRFQRSQQSKSSNSDSRDKSENSHDSSGKYQSNTSERPTMTAGDRDRGGGAGGSGNREKDGNMRNKENNMNSTRDKDSHPHGQDQKNRDDRYQSQTSFRQNNQQGKDQAKDRGRKDKDFSQHKGNNHNSKNNSRSVNNKNSNNHEQGNSGAGGGNIEDTRPDPLSLLSITGRLGSLTPHKPFFGNSRVVDDFEKLNKVGEGTYGVVYRARDKKTNEVVALKRIRMERENDGLPISSLREIKLLKTLRHDNIVLVKDVVVGSDLDQIFLVMEYCEHDMAALMDNVKKPYTPAEVKCLMYQLLKGIEYCHDHFVVHRDLKLSNLLLNSQGILKIADFGLARSFGLPSRPMTPKVVTLWYRAPELLFGDSNYTTAVDMWSAGCIFGELLKHAPLLPGKVEKQQVDLIIELLGTPHEKIWQGFNKLPMSSIKLPEQRFNNLRNKFPNITDAARSLLSGLLTYDPKKRLSVKQALAHPYFIESPPAKHPSLLPTHPEMRNLLSTRHEENAKLKRQAAGDETENNIGGNRKRMR